MRALLPRTAAALLAAAPGLVAAGYVLRNGVSVPILDDWAQVQLLQLYDHHQLTAANIWNQHNEHRIPLARLLLLGTDLATKGNSRVEMLLGVLALLGIAAMLLRDHLRAHGTSALALVAFLPISAVICSLRQSWNLLTSWQVPIFLCVLLVTASLVLLGGQRSRSRFAAAAVCGVATSFCFASGLLIWPAGALQLLWGPDRRAGRRAALVWVGLGAAVIAIYFAGYTKPAGHPSLLEPLRHPEVATQYFFASLGNPLSFEPWSAVGLGGLLFLAEVSALVLAARDAALPAYATGLILFCLGNSLLLTTGRAGFGFEQAISSRYVTLSMLGAIGAYVILLRGRGRSALAASALPALVALIALGTFLGMHDGFLQGRQMRAQRTLLAERLRDLDRQPDEALVPLFPSVPALRAWSATLRERHYSVFRDAP